MFPTSRSSFHETNRLDLSKIVLADDIEKSLCKFYEIGRQKEPLLFNFYNADFIDIAALINCIATFKMRKQNDLLTFIGYPRSKSVRDFLSIWKFFDAVTDATGVNIKDWLIQEDHHYIHEIQTTYNGVGGGINTLEYDADWNSNVGSKRNFFEFSTFKNEQGSIITPDGEFLGTAKIESKRWDGLLIKEVLKKHLGSNKPIDDIARVIIYEAISNAIRHPRAKTIQCVSKYIGPDQKEYNLPPSNVKQNFTKKDSIAGSFRICVWDDGDSIASTLLDIFDKDSPLTAFNLPRFMYEKMLVQIRDFYHHNLIERTFNQSEIPPFEDSELSLLLYSLSPGVTSSLARNIPQVHPFENQQTKGLEQYLHFAPGMGLYALQRTVLDQFQGSLFIRSGKYRLLLEIAHDSFRVQYKVRYKCKVTSYPDYYPSFTGNLIIIQLPVVK